MSATKLKLIKNLVAKLEMFDGNPSHAMYVTHHASEILRHISKIREKNPLTNNSQLNFYERKVKSMGNKASKRVIQLLHFRFEKIIDSIRKMQIQKSYASNQHRLKKDVSMLSNDIQEYLKLKSSNQNQRKLLNEVNFLRNYFFNADPTKCARGRC